MSGQIQRDQLDDATPGSSMEGARSLAFADDPTAKVWSSPGRVLMVERTYGGKIQTIRVDPDEVDALIACLEKCRDDATTEWKVMLG